MAIHNALLDGDYYKSFRVQTERLRAQHEPAGQVAARLDITVFRGRLAGAMIRVSDRQFSAPARPVTNRSQFRKCAPALTARRRQKRNRADAATAAASADDAIPLMMMTTMMTTINVAIVRVLIRHRRGPIDLSPVRYQSDFTTE